MFRVGDKIFLSKSRQACILDFGPLAIRPIYGDNQSREQAIEKLESRIYAKFLLFEKLQAARFSRMKKNAGQILNLRGGAACIRGCVWYGSRGRDPGPPSPGRSAWAIRQTAAPLRKFRERRLTRIKNRIGVEGREPGSEGESLDTHPSPPLLFFLLHLDDQSAGA